MAPSAGSLHSLLARNVKLARLFWNRATKTLQSQFPKGRAELQPALARDSSRHPLHPVAFLRQSKGRWYTTHSAINASKRQFSSNAAGSRVSKASLPKSRVGAAVSSFTGRAPFASTLRPNLTGGAFPRTAGGYGSGTGRLGGARYFSHTPAAPAQVIQNVSQAIRAFAVSGQKARFDGVDSRSGQKRFKAVTTLQDTVERKTRKVPKSSPGSYVDFKVNPTITALTPLSNVTGFNAKQESLNTEGLLDVLSVDFSRSLKDLAIVLSDLNKLATLGDLPITYHSSYLRVHFPGCDADTVERICDEMGIRRGLVSQDEDFDTFIGTDIALLFPFAPYKTVSECSFYEKPVAERMYHQESIDWRDLDRAGSPRYSTQSDTGLDLENEFVEDPWISSPSGYESLHSSEIESAPVVLEKPDKHTPLEYQGVEGIYRFIEQCDAAAARRW